MGYDTVAMSRNGWPTGAEPVTRAGPGAGPEAEAAAVAGL